MHKRTMLSAIPPMAKANRLPCNRLVIQMQKQDKLKEMGRQIGRLNDKIKLQNKFLEANAEEITLLRKQIKELKPEIKEEI